MDPTQTRVQSFLRHVVFLARQFNGTPESIRALHDVIAAFDSRDLMHLNRGYIPRTINSEGMISTGAVDVYKDDLSLINVFGFQKAGMRIPLHDHPGQYGIMKVFHGSVRIRSYSIVQTQADAKNLYPQWMFPGSETPKKTARFEGEIIIGASPSYTSHTALVRPGYGNLHEVTSLEPETYFMDVFLPSVSGGSYYHVDGPDPDTPGQLLQLKRLPGTPSEFKCDKLMFPKLYELH